MRSKHLAELAGVTPRALRHYHQIGLLAEPIRDRNNYRRYGVGHLIRLLRIKELAAAGVALNDMPAMLGGLPDDDALAALDARLAGRIERLQRQRQLVARLRQEAASSSSGSGSDERFRMLTEGRSDSATEVWREQIILFSHLLGGEALNELDRLYDQMARDREELLDLGKRFDALGPNSAEAEIEDLACAYGERFGDLIAGFSGLFSDRLDIGRLFAAHAMNRVNESQRRMLALLTARLS